MRQLEVRLTPWQRRRLLFLRGHAALRVAKRAMCLLRSEAGEPTAVIARVTGLSVDAITDIRRRWLQGGLRSLFDRSRTGRPSRITDAYRQALRRVLRSGPLACGYVFTVWSVARLAAHLRQTTGIGLGVDRLRQVIHVEGFGVGRPKHTLKGKRNPHAYAEAKKRLDRLKKGRLRQTPVMSCGTLTRRASSSCRIWSGPGCRGGNSRRSGRPA
jgi:transposase